MATTKEKGKNDNLKEPRYFSISIECDSKLFRYQPESETKNDNRIHKYFEWLVSKKFQQWSKYIQHINNSQL